MIIWGQGIPLTCQIAFVVFLNLTHANGEHLPIAEGSVDCASIWKPVEVPQKSKSTSII